MGQLMNSTPGMGGTNVADPGQSWGNMDSGQRGASVIGALKNGIGAGMKNYGAQQQAIQGRGGAQMPQMGAQQPVDPGYFQPQQRSRNDLNFYGGS